MDAEPTDKPSPRSTQPLRTERTDVPIEEIVDVIAIGRGVGLWGDMVITLKNQEKIELRSLSDFKKLEDAHRSRTGEADPELCENLKSIRKSETPSGRRRAPPMIEYVLLINEYYTYLYLVRSRTRLAS